MSDPLISTVRTIVPVLVAAILAGPVGPYLDPQLTERAVVVVLALGYYTGARFLERRWPSAGWLLAFPAEPRYTLEVSADE